METGKNTVSKGAVLFVAAVGSFLTPFMASAVNIALPSIQHKFQLNAVTLSWLVTSYLLAAAVSMVPFGRLADIYGRRAILTFGMAAFTVTTFLCGISNSPAMLLVSRVAQGVGSAMIFSTGLAMVTSVFPPGERGRAMGITVASVYIGLSLGPSLGGLLTEHLGWRSVFLVNVPLGLVTLGLILVKIKTDWIDARGERFDLIGSLIYGLALVAVMIGISGLPDPESAVLLFFGVVGIVTFVLWEQKSVYPVFEVNLFRKNRVFAFSGLAALLNYSATHGVVFLLSLYLQFIKGLSPRQAGVILITQPIFMALFSPWAGRLSDRIEPAWVASIGMTLTATGLFLLSFISPETRIAWLVAYLVILGLGFALFSSPNTNAIMSSVERRYLGIAAGAVSTMRLLGQMTSMAIATLIFALLIGRVQIAPENYPQFLLSVRTAFLIFAGLCFIGIIASMVRGKMPGTHGETQKTP